ncbi:transporter (NhaC family) [Scopulibacillus darangshiensis]|uniref:Transporter (NhaC family) n=1 Tax=Scopulibacillus darangshiensis TaxID=442528 RepID=A0A4R2P6I5_9BACL|nr:Na+/H+ antiporter NhaC [Scopulibacillus darangshiensis]TCP29601.1 transporter (NhaC family) [Scopulibacillus darangshiensis]
MRAKQPGFFQAIIPLVILMITAGFSIFVWNVGMFVPLIAGILAAAILGYLLGYKWTELEKFLMQGVYRALTPIFILFLIGTIVGTWILSGVIPTLIYYGLALIHPSMFVPAVALTTGILALSLGSSFTSIATLGLAFMAIGQSMGFPPALVAGAVISGAYLGDKISPLSDTTNVAPAMVDTDLFSHVRHMMWDTIPAFIISLILYWIVGMQFSFDSANIQNVQDVMKALDASFNIQPLLLVLPLFTIVVMIKRLSAVPSLMLISVLGAVAAAIFQSSTVTEIVTAITNGYTGKTGVKTVDALLRRGGITSMLNTIGLIIVATALGGILEGTGAFKAMTDIFIGKVRRTGSLILSTLASTFIVGFASGSQFLAVILSARSFTQTYKDRGLATKNLSRCVEAAGTVGINLVPWGVPAVFAAGILGVSPYQFIPYIFFAFLVPIINAIYGYTGFSIAKQTYSNSESPSSNIEVSDTEAENLRS